MSLHNEQIAFGPNTSAVLLGRATRPAPSPVAELESVAVLPVPAEEKVIAGVRAAADKAKNPEVSGILGTIADMIETGQKPKTILEAVSGARSAIADSGGDFMATRELLKVSRMANETLGRDSGIVQEKQAPVVEIINSDLMARATALAAHKYGEPKLAMETELPTSGLTPAGIAISRKNQLS